MITPVKTFMPNFRAIYSSKEYMELAQSEVADKIQNMLTSDKFKNNKGMTLEEQAGAKADVFISQPKYPYKSTTDEQSVDVSIAYTRYVDMSGKKFGPREFHEVGRFNKDNVETFADKFQKTSTEYNSDKLDKRINICALVVGAVALLATLFCSGKFFAPRANNNSKPIIEKVVEAKDTLVSQIHK